MKCLFFTGLPRSHVLPLEPLIKDLKIRGHIVYALGDINNKKLLENMGAVFIDYPIDTLALEYDELREKYNRWSEKNFDEGNFLSAHIYELYADAISTFNVTLDKLKIIEELVDFDNVDLIFGDSVNRFWKFLVKKHKKAKIGYITHNLYSSDFFQISPEKLYKIFMFGILKEKYLPPQFYKNFYEIETLIYETCIEITGHKYPPKPFEQYNLDTDFGIIFSIHGWQPMCQHNRNILKIVTPNLNRFDIEDNLEKNFVRIIKDKKVIFIGVGGFNSHEIEYFIKLITMINLMNLKEYNIIISALDKFEELKKYVKLKKLDKKVFVYKYVPQQFVLSNASLFITMGGQNSIIESIFHKVPMLVIPKTSEQRINGWLVEENGLGYTVYNIREEKKKFNDLVKELLNDNLKIKTKLGYLSQNMQSSKNKFDDMYEFLKENYNLK